MDCFDFYMLNSPIFKHHSYLRSKSFLCSGRRSGKGESEGKEDYDIVTDEDRKSLASRGYQLYNRVGQGVSAQIYLASTVDDGKKVTLACKVIDKKKGDPKFLTKFLPRELHILLSLSNPYCIRTFGMYEFPDRCFIFMRYAEEGDLLDYLSKKRIDDAVHARIWMRQMLLGLKYLHSKDVAHRDIKCENILITANLNVKLADFGFARHWLDSEGREVLSKTYCGSMSYAAPEVLRGEPYPPKFCDVWSLGVVFFIMVNLNKPFNKTKASQLLQQQLNKEYRFRSKADKLMDESGKDMIRHMLEPDMHLRYTAKQLLDYEWLNREKDIVQLVPDI